MPLYHVWYSALSASVGGTVVANLDVDDTTSYGPETTTVYSITDGTKYSFVVHDYSNGGSANSMALSNSGAYVKLYSGSTLLANFVIPENRVGIDWHVFDYDSATDSFAIVNTFS